MSKPQKTLILFALTAAAFSPTVRADESNQKTVFTFSDRVEIPGRVLNAGTYVFKVANSQSSRNIVQVFTGDERQILATFITIPDYKLTPSDKTIITFAERPAGSPQAVKGWFYPGRTYGHEFVYPKNEAVQLAHTMHTPVPAMPTELASEIVMPDISLSGPEIERLEEAPLKVEKPDGTEVEITAVFMTTATANPAPVLASNVSELPETASNLPLIAMAGLMLVGLGATLRLAAARTK